MAQVIKINAITVPADSGDELARRFAARAGAVDDQDGFEGFELLQPTDDRTVWLVVTRGVTRSRSRRGSTARRSATVTRAQIDRAARWPGVGGERAVVLRRGRRLRRLSVRLQLKEQLKAQLEGHPVATTRVATLAQRVGAHRVNRRLLSGADIVSVTPPYSAARPLTLARSHGRDQIATALATHGWLGFERPVPDVFADAGASAGRTRARRRCQRRLLRLARDVGRPAMSRCTPSSRIHPSSSCSVEPRDQRWADRVRVFEQAIGRDAGRALLHITGRPARLRRDERVAESRRSV